MLKFLKISHKYTKPIRYTMYNFNKIINNTNMNNDSNTIKKACNNNTAKIYERSGKNLFCSIENSG